MDMFDFAGLLFGGSRTAPDATTVTATGAGASADGEVGITLDADVTPAEDTGVEGDADQTVIDLPTSPDVDEGDELIVTLVGDGPLKTPVVTANPGSGDRMRALVNAAQTVADAAQAVAEAVNQHFFADTNGIHVTEATQEEWDESHTGANVLINSIGQLFRDGLNNLLTLTTESGARALTIWDGLGNSASNILARFSSDGISFADGTSFDIGDSSSYIHFDGNGHINIGGSGLTIGGYIPTGGVTVNDLTQAAQDATLNSNISVGGRNLLRNTNWNTETVKKFKTADSSTNVLGNAIGEWHKETRVTLGFDASGLMTITVPNNTTRYGIYQDVSLLPGHYILSVDTGSFFKSHIDSVQWPAKNIINGSNSRNSVEIDVAEEAIYRVYIAYNNGAVIYGNYIKLEKGTKATDWSPASEDVDSAIESVPQYKVRTTTYSYPLSSWLTYAAEGYQSSWSQVGDVKVGDTVLLKGTNSDTGDAVYVLMTVDELRASGRVNKATSHGLVDPTAGQRADNAAKTATSYVTDITGGGIMVHPSGDQTTGVQITDDVDILRDGTSVINIGTDDAVRVGSASGGHIAIDSDSMGFWASAAQLAMRFTGQKVDYPSGISTYFAQIEDGVTRENEVYNDNSYISLYTREEPTYEGSDEKVVTESMATMHAYARGAEGTAEISVFMHQDPDANTASRGAIIASDTLTCEGTTNVGDPYGSVDGLTIGSPTRVTSSKSCTALTNDTMGPYVALTAGKWLIMGNWGFTNTSSSAKRLTIGLYRNATGSSYTRRVHTTAPSSTAHKLEVVDTIVLTSDEVITLYASSSPASTSASTQWITAVRLS